MANFKVNSVPSWVQYTATQSQTEFSIPFPFIDNVDIYVWLNGVLLTLTTDYTLAGANTASGGQLTLNVGANLNDQITIQDLMVIDRTNIYLPVISALTGSALNNDFNRDVIMIRDTTTTVNYLMLQYEPYALISQDLSVTTDRIIPLLGPLQVWQKDPTNTFIQATTLPATVIGIEGSFANTNRIVSTYLTPGPNYVQQTDFQIVNDVISTQTGNMTITGSNDVNINTPGQIYLIPGGSLYLDGTQWPTTTGSQFQVPRFKSGSSTQLEWADVLSVTLPVQDNHIARFDGTLGSVQESLVVIDDLGNVTGALTYVAGNMTVASNQISTATGDLTISAASGNQLVPNNPTQALGIATKQYVDSAIGGAPGGSPGDIQFNNAGSFGGDSITTDGSGGWTGNIALTGTFKAGNLELETNTLSSTNTNGNINLTPNGSGINVLANAQVTSLTASTVLVSDSSKNVTSSSVAASTLPYFQTQNGAVIYAADSGSTNTFAVTLSPIPSSYVTGMVVNFKAANANTGAATLNVNSLGAIAIKKNASAALVSGDISSGQIVTVIYDGTNFQMQSQITNTTDGGGVNAGLINQLGYYAAAGNIISGLATANNGVAVTSAGGVPSISTTLPTGLALSTPISGTLTNCTGLPVGTGISGLGTGVATALGSAVNGSGSIVLTTSPALVTPALGTPSSGVLTNCTGLPVAGGGTGNATATAYAVLCGGTTTTGALQSIAGVGTSGQVLTSNGAGALPTFQAAGGGGVNKVINQTFTASGTYTPSTGLIYCIIEVIGSGGGGGGTIVGGSNNNSAGAGGGSGGYSVGVFSAATIGASKAVTIGSSGSGSSGAAGGNGSACSVGALISANGGSGGAAMNSAASVNFAVGGAGGMAGSGGYINVPGNAGAIGCFSPPSNSSIGGEGAASQIGGAATSPAATSTTVAGNNASANTGAGGSGSASNKTGSASSAAGGNGGTGIVIITEYTT